MLWLKECGGMLWCGVNWLGVRRLEIGCSVCWLVVVYCSGLCGGRWFGLCVNYWYKNVVCRMVD